ncbi:MAG: hypothetical protein MJY70_04680 [Bacteroidales bacterium]|nr:hypothetical protein [Bacteroidales bacterium]
MKKMKFWFALPVMMAAMISCKEVSIEEQLSTLFGAVADDAAMKRQIGNAESYSGADLTDYYTYLLAKDAKVGMKEIMEVDDLLTAKIHGIKKKDRTTIILTADRNDRTSCIVGIGILKLFRTSEIKFNHNIRLVIYSDALSVPSDLGEETLFRMNLHRIDTLETHILHMREAPHIYARIKEEIPKYLDSYSKITFSDEVFDPERPFRHEDYDYNICSEETSRETATLAALIHLLN